MYLCLKVSSKGSLAIATFRCGVGRAASFDWRRHRQKPFGTNWLILSRGLPIHLVTTIVAKKCADVVCLYNNDKKEITHISNFTHLFPLLSSALPAILLHVQKQKTPHCELDKTSSTTVGEFTDHVAASLALTVTHTSSLGPTYPHPPLQALWQAAIFCLFCPLNIAKQYKKYPTM